jgi:hypothetical protein
MKHFPRMNYSVMTGSKNDQYIDFDIVALEGPCKVIAERDEFYGGKKSKPYEGALLVNPTWGQLFIEAMKQQQKTLNFHHIFLEGGRIVGTVKNENGETIVQFINLSLGS